MVGMGEISTALVGLVESAVWAVAWALRLQQAVGRLAVHMVPEALEARRRRVLLVMLLGAAQWEVMRAARLRAGATPVGAVGLVVPGQRIRLSQVLIDWDNPQNILLTPPFAPSTIILTILVASIN